MLTITRSTTQQRRDLERLAAELRATYEGMHGRFWAWTADRGAYETVLAHLERWIGWVKDDD